MREHLEELIDFVSLSIECKDKCGWVPRLDVTEREEVPQLLFQIKLHVKGH